MKKPPSQKIPIDAPTALTHNPFAKLPGAAIAAPSPAATPPSAKPEPIPARAVVRLERKGRGGKEVTVIEQLGLRPRDLESYLKAMKKQLGCGGVLEDDTLVLQGDHRERAAAWLTGRGVPRVIRGS